MENLPEENKIIWRLYMTSIFANWPWPWISSCTPTLPPVGEPYNKGVIETPPTPLLTLWRRGPRCPWPGPRLPARSSPPQSPGGGGSPGRPPDYLQSAVLGVEGEAELDPAAVVGHREPILPVLGELLRHRQLIWLAQLSHWKCQL